MITRRGFLGAAAGAGVLALVPATQAHATGQTDDQSANGWPIEPAAIATFRIEGSTAEVALRQGYAAAVLLHIARRWHYEIAPLDTGEGGGVEGHTTHRTAGPAYESNYLSGTAIALHPTAYPTAGSERLYTHHEAIVRDILVDCAGTVVWGGDLKPTKFSHFQLATSVSDPALVRVAGLLDTMAHREFRTQTAGTVADPATPARRQKARDLPRPR